MDQTRGNKPLYIYNSKFGAANVGKLYTFVLLCLHPEQPEPDFNKSAEIGNDAQKNNPLFIPGTYSLLWTPIPAEVEKFNLPQFF